MDYTYSPDRQDDRPLAAEPHADRPTSWRTAAGWRCATTWPASASCPIISRRCAEILAGSTVKASTTIGFPHGGHTTAIKVAEAKQALADGGQELDMVVNISKVLSGDWDYVRARHRAP